MPRLWTRTIEAHRREVDDAIVSSAAALVEERGLRSVTMSAIAERAGIGRATLYKYFPDVEAILLAWHERQISQHLDRLVEARDRVTDPAEKLDAVLHAFALISRGFGAHTDSELAAFLHRDEQVVHAQRRVTRLVRDVVAEAAAAGQVRDDVTPEELASYCLHAVAGARGARSKAAVRRLVNVTLAGMRPPG